MAKEHEAQDRKQKIGKLAGEVLALARDNILVSLRFLDVALLGLVWQERPSTGCVSTDGSTVWYDPEYILRLYRLDPHLVTRGMLHLLLHCIFSHSFAYDKVERELWDMAADMAVESVILELELPMASLDTDSEAEAKLRVWREDVGVLTAERIYRYMRHHPITPRERQELAALFWRDDHARWMPAEELQMTPEQWKKISERVKADLKSFTRSRAGMQGLEKNLAEATRDRYDYSAILKRFTVMGEDMTVNDEEFDYIYYTYGLERYGNMPLIEPLEYKDAKKVKEFVIALDTSASCRGPVVRAFLNRTYSLLKGSENFFTKINVHIIQCDNEVQSDTKITCDEDFQEFLAHGRLQGFGATDFRPVFDYVDSLLEQGEFENLKGLIYFTDGYGIYPERMPGYDVIFAFLEEDEMRRSVPPWSMKVIIEEE
ncbi:MAG: VWA-like domain-containing protein [bacterium]|nr:VWA-like domain-containing protein [bacterium]MCM1376455.1 VWA-like domain-containing protein [Muribaculum sp.]